MRDDDSDPEAEAFLEDDGPGGSDGQAVAATARDIVSRFGQEAPLRAELAAQDALAIGDVASYRLFKLVEGAAEDLLLLQPRTAIAG